MYLYAKPCECSSCKARTQREFIRVVDNSFTTEEWVELIKIAAAGKTADTVATTEPATTTTGAKKHP
jgi:hypothetical protein